MTDQEKWAAVTGNDAAFDRLFFYGVKTTKIFCRPSCPSRVPRRENAVFFATAAEALRAGFRPCKRCRPDLAVYAPDKDTAEHFRALLDAGSNALSGLGLTRRRAAELFQAHYGVSPREYRSRARLEQAQALLSGSQTPIADVAWTVGFESVPAFYRFFRARTGTSPAAYRRQSAVKEDTL